MGSGILEREKSGVAERMTPDFRGFADYVTVEAEGAEFLSLSRERELKLDGLRSFGLRHDEAGWVIHGVVRECGIAAESTLDQLATDVLGEYRDRRNRIRREDFRRVTRIYRAWSGNSVGEEEIHAKVKRIMDRNDWKPRRRGLLRSRRWYRRIKTS